MKKFCYLVISFILISLVISCSNLEDTATVSFMINGSDISRDAVQDVGGDLEYTVVASILGDYKSSQKVTIREEDTCVFTFDSVPVRAKVYAEISIYCSTTNYDSSVFMFYGKSETIPINPGINNIYLDIYELRDDTQLSVGRRGYYTDSEEPDCYLSLYDNGKYVIASNDQPNLVLSEGIWYGSGFDDNPFEMESPITLCFTEHVYGTTTNAAYISKIVDQQQNNEIYIPDPKNGGFVLKSQSGLDFRFGSIFRLGLPQSNAAGSLMANKNVSFAGESITVTVVPNSGFIMEPDTLNIVDNNGTSITLATGARANEYTFVMPASNVSISASFISNDLIKVEGGTVVGSNENNLVPNSQEVYDDWIFKSGRTVSINDLYVCNHEVTQKEYELYCKYGADVPETKGDNYPVIQVSWYDAIVYCNLRSIAEGLTPVYSKGDYVDPRYWNSADENIQIDENGKCCAPSVSNGAIDLNNWKSITCDFNANGYRLPTEAEWEYTARSKMTESYPYSGSDNLDIVAWNKNNSSNQIQQVKTKASNALGIYDMTGNVYEWCWDWYGTIDNNTQQTGNTTSDSDEYGRIQRGGAFKSGDGTEEELYFYVVSYREYDEPAERYSSVGFRVVRSIR